jgi:hypothetical protein
LLYTVTCRITFGASAPDAPPKKTVAHHATSKNRFIRSFLFSTIITKWKTERARAVDVELIRSGRFNYLFKL